MTAETTAASSCLREGMNWSPRALQRRGTHILSTRPQPERSGTKPLAVSEFGAAVEEKKLRFVHVPAEAREELLAIVTRVFGRANKWLRKKGYLRDDASDANVAPERTFEEALVLAAMTRGLHDHLDKSRCTESPEPSLLDPAAIGMFCDFYADSPPLLVAGQRAG